MKNLRRTEHYCEYETYWATYDKRDIGRAYYLEGVGIYMHPIVVEYERVQVESGWKSTNKILVFGNSDDAQRLIDGWNQDNRWDFSIIKMGKE